MGSCLGDIGSACESTLTTVVDSFFPSPYDSIAIADSTSAGACQSRREQSSGCTYDGVQIYDSGRTDTDR